MAGSEPPLLALADNMPQLAWMARPDGHVFWYNRRWFDFTGTTLAQMGGWGWRTVQHPDHVQRVLARFRHCIETGTPWEDSFPLRRADGVYRWFLSRAEPVRDAQGSISMWFGTNTDVTEAREADERRAFLLKLTEALRDLSDPVAMLETATALLGHRLGVAQVGFGEVDDATGQLMVHRDWNDGRIPSVAGSWRMDDFGPAFIDAMKHGQTAVIPDITRDPRTNAPKVKAAYRAISVRAILDVPYLRDGRLVAMLFIHHPEPRAWTADEVELVEETCRRLWPAVERARAEARLRESEARLRFVLESSPDNIFIQDRDLRYLLMTRPSQVLPPEVYVGRTDEELTDLREEGEHLSAIKRQVMAEGSVTALELPLLLNGKRRVFDATYKPWRDGAMARGRWPACSAMCAT